MMSLLSKALFMNSSWSFMYTKHIILEEFRTLVAAVLVAWFIDNITMLIDSRIHNNWLFWYFCQQAFFTSWNNPKVKTKIFSTTGNCSLLAVVNRYLLWLYCRKLLMMSTISLKRSIIIILCTTHFFLRIVVGRTVGFKFVLDDRLGNSLFNGICCY